jgi:hypothetical protein
MKLRSAVLCLGLLALPFMRADEGIWLFNQFPKQRVKRMHGVDVSDDFLARLRSASVRMNNGGSGSFVSPGGLIFTNHHVASDCIQKLSSAEHDYMTNGFHVAAPEDEKACPDLEINILLRIDDVTSKVNQGVAGETPAAEANRLRKAASTVIEKECGDTTGNRCDVVNLYSGGLYHLYRYKKYTDVRLVFAPEVAIAAFGGDPDNFTYPRYCLDFAFLRAYENGKPVSTPNYLRWSRRGARDGELTFVSGHPGTTGRLATLAALEFFRDTSYPFVLDYVKSLIGVLQGYSDLSAENKRIAYDNLFGHQNSFKAFTGFLRGLRDPDLMSRKRDEEQTLRAKVAGNAAVGDKYANTWDEIAAAYKEYAAFYQPYFLLELQAGRGSDLFDHARTILRYAEERTKPDADRLREYVDPALPSVEQKMFSSAPLHPSMEVVALANYLRYLDQNLPEERDLVKKLLDGGAPEEAAKRYVETSKLTDVAERKRLAGDVAAARASTDGMMVLVRLLDPVARSYRKKYEDRVEAVLNSAAGQIASARFAIYGADEYPDATFTLRLSYGPVRGYKNTEGRPVPWATDFAGLYARATGEEPFRLPQRWIDKKPALNLRTPFNFVTTNDTHGGNSGSPTVNPRGEVVGILFDGNIEGLPNRFVYRDEQERSVHVASQGIVEALRKVYGARRILTELGMR